MICFTEITFNRKYLYFDIFLLYITKKYLYYPALNKKQTPSTVVGIILLCFHFSFHSIIIRVSIYGNSEFPGSFSELLSSILKSKIVKIRRRTRKLLVALNCFSSRKISRLFWQFLWHNPEKIRNSIYNHQT